VLARLYTTRRVTWRGTLKLWLTWRDNRNVINWYRSSPGLLQKKQVASTCFPHGRKVGVMWGTYTEYRYHCTLRNLAECSQHQNVLAACIWLRMSQVLAPCNFCLYEAYGNMHVACSPLTGGPSSRASISKFGAVYRFVYASGT